MFLFCKSISLKQSLLSTTMLCCFNTECLLFQYNAYCFNTMLIVSIECILFQYNVYCFTKVYNKGLHVTTVFVVGPCDGFLWECAQY